MDDIRLRQIAQYLRETVALADGMEVAALPVDALRALLHDPSHFDPLPVITKAAKEARSSRERRKPLRA